MKTLVITDNPQDEGIVRKNLHGMADLSLETGSPEEAHKLLQQLPDEELPDLLLLSYATPGDDGLKFLTHLRQILSSPPPVLVLAGQDDEHVAVEYMKAGAFDFLSRREVNTHGDRLRKSVQSALEKRELEKDLAQATREIQRMAFTDGLTGLFNRHFFNETLNKEYENALRYGYPLSCIMVDVDFFKEINDRFGHLFGDEALRQIAGAIQGIIRAGDLAARFGGDEFVILLPHTDRNGSRVLAERIRALLSGRTPVATANEKIFLTASFGISSLMPGSLFSKEDLLNQADDALYRAKKSGKNQIVTWTPDPEEPLEQESPALGQIEYYKKSLQRMQLQVKTAYMELTESLVRAIESRDPLVGDFSKKVMGLALSTAQQMGLPAEEVEIIKNAAILHDIGMIGIPDKILLKKTPLTPEERESIQRHPAIGVEMLLPVTFLDRERLIILHHHERYDGRGYPHRLRGERIPLGARIIALADAYVAMCHDRTHRRRRGTREAVQEIIINKGKQFDPAVVDAFLRIV